MDRHHELEYLRRSLAMIQPGQLAMRRERALEVVEELIDLRRQFDKLIADLRGLVHDAEPRSVSG